MKKIRLGLCVLLCAVLLAGCAPAGEAGLQEGYFTAEATGYSHGWKEFVTICVRDGRVVTVEYNARNASGFIKSWDMDYMGLMNSITGAYPNQYTRFYGAQLLEDQHADGIDGLAGASHSYNSFQQLGAAVLERARAGDTTVAQVDIDE